MENQHYKTTSKQPIEIMMETFTKEQFVGFLLGNIVKYSLRFGKKDDVCKEASKIAEYSKWLKEFTESGTITVSRK